MGRNRGCFHKLDRPTMRRPIGCRHYRCLLQGPLGCRCRDLGEGFGVWNTALVNHRVPAKDLDLAHSFKDDLLELAHTFDDLSISATYGDVASYTTAVGDIRTTLGHINDLKNQALAAGITLSGQAPSVGGSTQ